MAHCLAACILLAWLRSDDRYVNMQDVLCLGVVFNDDFDYQFLMYYTFYMEKNVTVINYYYF